MLLQLAVATLMVMMAVAMHGIGLALLGRAVSGERREERAHHVPPLSPRATLFTLGVVLTLFVLHGLEIWCFALFYILVEALPSFETALFFSTISYGAIGYGGAQIAVEWRLVGAIEGITGVILLGWSTAFFVSLLARWPRS